MPILSTRNAHLAAYLVWAHHPPRFALDPDGEVSFVWDDLAALVVAARFLGERGVLPRGRLGRTVQSLGRARQLFLSAHDQAARPSRGRGAR